MKYFLLGKTLSYSFSEMLHRYRGLDYSLKELKEEEVGDFIRGGDYSGLNVTIPYKKAVTPFLDGVDPLAARLGAVNTVVCKDGKKWGYNTDYAGFLKTIERCGAIVKGKNAIVLGSGGAANTARRALEDLGAKSAVIVSRTGEVDYLNVYDRKDTEIIVNATPVGTSPNIDAMPIVLSGFKKLSFVFDLVYNPFRTRLVYEAEKLGIKCSGGLYMLVTQALESEKLWTGENYSESDIEDCIDYILFRTRSIVLVGMPSSGKTTIGKTLAARLGREFYDCDEEFENTFGSSPAEIIRREGEAAMREKESEILNRLLCRRGVVIATGGGAVMIEGNRRRLKETAFTVYIRRPLGSLDTCGRPLSEEKGVKRLFEERKVFYEEAGDIAVDNIGSTEECAEEIIKRYENTRH